MPRQGQCPSCDRLFDAVHRVPMVSVVCGHSLCKHCATRRPSNNNPPVPISNTAVSSATARNNHSANAHCPSPSSDSSSTASDENALPRASAQGGVVAASRPVREGGESEPEGEGDVALCPVCSKPLEGFVTNFEALAALAASSQSNVAAHASSPTASSSHAATGAVGGKRRDGDGVTSSTVSPSRAAEQQQGQQIQKQQNREQQHPDLTAVVTEDLVIDRGQIHFVRAPSHELGRGGSAVVYKGLYRDGPVAIKCIRTMSDSFATEDRLRRELRNASRLKNAHIVEFRGAAWDFEDGPSSPRNVLLVTEMMEGGNLRESLNKLQEGCGLAVDSFVHIALQIARGIEYLHAEGLAHRDIKSANILLTERMPKYANRFSPSVRAKIADFGLSKYIDKATGGGTVAQSIMEPGRLEATYAYLAPEAFGGDKTNVIRRNDSDDEGDARYDTMAKKRDIYALGVVFWEMLTGAIPWSGVALPDVYVRVCVRSDRPAPALDDKAVDRTFHRLIDRCWAQNPSRRPSARSIVAKLEKLALKYPLADGVSSAAVESVSVVSGQASVRKETEGRREVSGHGGETLAAYHKMPSASTVHTVQNEDARTQSHGFDASEGGLDRTVEDIPTQYEDLVSVEDGDMNGKTALAAQRSSSMHVVGNTASHGNSDPHDNPALHARRSVRSGKMGGSDHGDGSVVRVSSHGYHATVSSSAVAAGLVSAGATAAAAGAASVSAGAGKTNATAVAATAAAIAAAKDRERKRDDVRYARGSSASAAARVARGTNGSGANGASGGNTTAAGGPVADSSFQSLAHGAGQEVWTGRGPTGGVGVTGKDKTERIVFYDNSDEEAQDFDPDRAAADEAIAESNNVLLAAHQGTHQGGVAAGRSATPVNRGSIVQAQRSTSLGRVAGGRPKSPVVRRPMSPSVGRSYVPGVSSGRGSAVEGADEARGTHSLSRNSTSDGANGVTVGPKRSTSTNRGRLGRTLSASASGNNGARAAVPSVTAGVSSTASATAVGSSSANAVGGGPNTLQTSVSGTIGGTNGDVGGNAGGNGFLGGGSGGGLVTSTSTTADGTGRRAFIRRMRSNESAKRIARSSSSTGVENKRSKGYGSGATGQDNGHGHGHGHGYGRSHGHGHGYGHAESHVSAREAAGVVATKSSPCHISESMGSEDEVMERDSGMVSRLGGGGAVHANSTGSGKENFIGMVEAVDKAGLMRLLGQPMQHLRLAALTHAALLSARHRNDEEVLRNCCAHLHRLTVPTGSSSSASAASGQGGSAAGSHSGSHHHHHHRHGPSGRYHVSTKEQLSIRKYLKARQGVEALLQALHPPEVRHPTTLCYGLLALGNLIAWDLEAHKQFRTCHGVQQVTKVMKVHSTHSGVQEKGCYALACVGAVYPIKAKCIFEQSGALDMVIRALAGVEGREANDAVTKQACAALGAMCSGCSSNAIHAGRKDALSYLVTSFERFRKVSKGDGGGKRSEMRLVCKAFIDLLCDAENRKVAGAKSASTMIIRAMRIFRLDADFIEKGLATLGQLCVQRTHGTQIVQANGMDDIVAAMERFRMSTGMQREGCRVVAQLMKTTGDQGRRRMVQAGGAEAIVAGLERFGVIADANEEVVVVEACAALAVLFAMENSTEGEALGRRMRKMRCDKAIRTAMVTHRQHAAVQAAGKDALRQLASLRGGGGLWSRMRNGSKKW